MRSTFFYFCSVAFIILAGIVQHDPDLTPFHWVILLFLGVLFLLASIAAAINEEEKARKDDTKTISLHGEEGDNGA